jgi:hypothetical protein
MQVNKFVTISTLTHLYKTAALAESLARYGHELEVWLIDELPAQFAFQIPKSCQLRSIDQLQKDRLTPLFSRFKRHSDQLRWSLKSVVLEQALLDGADTAIYLDNDQYFIHSPASILAAFQQHSILLTPHFYPIDPNRRGGNWFEASYQVGVYNAGFIGVRKDAISFLNWWFNCCTYSVRKSYFRGLFDDQKYLDAVPAFFPKVYIHEAPTWNFAAWNDWVPEINWDGNQLKIGATPIVFVHFATLTLEQFALEKHCAHEVYQQYVSHLKQFIQEPIQYTEPLMSRRKILNFLRYLHWRFLTTLQD